MKSNKIIFIFTFFVLINSCKKLSDQEKDQKDTEDCITEKSKNEKSKSIDDALNNFDFVAARRYLECFPNTNYDQEGKRSEYGNGNLNKSYLNKIISSELSFWLKQGEFDRAIAIIDEGGQAIDNAFQSKIKVIKEAVDYFCKIKDFNSANLWALKAPPNQTENGGYVSGNVENSAVQPILLKQINMAKEMSNN